MFDLWQAFGGCESQELVNGEVLNFDGIESPFFWLGLISAFENRYQAVADTFFQEISWKQFFTMICIKLCKTAPKITELADIIGTSHQNTRQILKKLQAKNFIKIATSADDKRKQYVTLTEKGREFCEERHKSSKIPVKKIFSGLDEKQIQLTIQTIIQLEKNLEKLSEE